MRLKLPTARLTARTALVVAVLVALGLFAARHSLLRSMGALLIVNDAVQRADIAVMTSESLEAGELEVADLFARGIVGRVGVLIPEPSPAVRELKRRGVVLDDPERILMQLGVPREAIVSILAGEGGTTEGTQALAQWCLANGIRRLIVVTAANHSRRVHRALKRAFGDTTPVILIRTPHADPFRSTDWWQQRTTLRSGLIELQKLFLDYVSHPVG